MELVVRQRICGRCRWCCGLVDVYESMDCFGSASARPCRSSSDSDSATAVARPDQCHLTTLLGSQATRTRRREALHAIKQRFSAALLCIRKKKLYSHHSSSSPGSCTSARSTISPRPQSAPGCSACSSSCTTSGTRFTRYLQHRSYLYAGYVQESLLWLLPLTSLLNARIRIRSYHVPHCFMTQQICLFPQIKTRLSKQSMRRRQGGRRR